MRAMFVGGMLVIVHLGCGFPDPNGEALQCCELPDRATAPTDASTGDDVPAMVPTATTPDVGVPPTPPTRCLPTTPFGPATLVPGIDASKHSSSPHLTPDERTLVFTGNDGVSSEVFRASRATRDLPFGPAVPVPGLNSASNDNDPTVSSDGLTLVFHSGRGGNTDVWWAKRASLAAEFDAPVLVPGIATAAYEGQGFFHVAADELWFVSNRSGNYDLFKAKRAGDTFGAATPVTELNTAQDDFLPFLAADGLTIVFSSTRAGGKGGQDLYVATRVDPDGAFGTATPIVEVNTSASEQAGSLSPDGCRLYLSREGGPGGQQLYVAERPLPL